MQIILDCGTTNTKIYFIEDKKSIAERYLHMGIKDIARSNDKTRRSSSSCRFESIKNKRI